LKCNGPFQIFRKKEGITFRVILVTPITFCPLMIVEIKFVYCRYLDISPINLCISKVPICHKIEQKTFFLQIGHFVSKKTQNFTLIPNPKFRKNVPIKRSFENTSKKCFLITFYWCTQNYAFFCTHIELFQGKKLSAPFCICILIKKIHQNELLTWSKSQP